MTGVWQEIRRGHMACLTTSPHLLAKLNGGQSRSHRVTTAHSKQGTVLASFAHELRSIRTRVSDSLASNRFGGCLEDLKPIYHQSSSDADCGWETTVSFMSDQFRSHDGESSWAHNVRLVLKLCSDHMICESGAESALSNNLVRSFFLNQGF